ncbi:MAG TPA: hypothetical protein VL242_31785, partial [Sorangium sp.]|nr:hypothetical protein [Sorangium sp.]
APCAGPTACAELSPAALRGRRIFHQGRGLPAPVSFTIEPGRFDAAAASAAAARLRPRAVLLAGEGGASLSRVDPSSVDVVHPAPVSAWVEVVP